MYQESKECIKQTKDSPMIVSKKSIKPIGGYMPLQVPTGSSYYPTLIAVNAGRNALEYILRIRKYDIIYFPYFTCEVLLEPLLKTGIQYRFYKIDENLDPILDFEMEENSCLLYTNYFGIKTNTVKWLSTTIKNLIIDNAQAFYAAPIKNVDTFYSCRKFFGVPDGAYVYTSAENTLHLELDHSIERFSHLIKSIDYTIEDGYLEYLKNNETLCYSDIKSMSVLTQTLLESIDYEGCAQVRKDNFNYLHQQLGSINKLKIDFAYDDVPMVYPLLIENPKLREKLISNKIFIPIYWPNVFDWASPESYEYFLSKNLISIPIDHRYTREDMQSLLTTLNSLL